MTYPVSLSGAIYGFGRIPESIPGQVFYVIAFPAAILVGAKLFTSFQHWAERRGWSPLDFVLNRPRVLAGVYVLLFYAPMGVRYGTELVMRWFALERYRGMTLASGYTATALVVFQLLAFALIVMIIARRRLRLRQC